MYATLQLPYLSRIVLAAVDWQHMKALEAGGITLKGLGYLDRQLPGRGENHDLDLQAAGVDASQQGQGKSGGLTGAGGGVSQQVQSLQQVGYGLCLNRGRRFIANLIQRSQERGRQLQIAKAGEGWGGIGHRGFLVEGKGAAMGQAGRGSILPGRGLTLARISRWRRGRLPKLAEGKVCFVA